MLPSSPAHRFDKISLLALAVATLGLASCAAIPTATTTTPVNPDTLASAEAVKGETGAWPDRDWWKGFNDPQLNALMDEALANSPDMKTAQARIQKATAVFDQVKAVRSPTLTLNGSVEATKQSYNMGFPEEFKAVLPQGYWYADRLTLDASYDLDLWGKQKAAQKGALDRARAAALDAEIARQNLAAALTGAYIELDRLYQERDDLSEIGQGADARVNLVQARLDHNLDTTDNLLDAQDDQAQANQRLSAINGAIRLQTNLIAALAGAGPDRGLALGRPQLAPASADSLPSDVRLNLLGRRPDVQAARLRVEAMGQQIKYYKADFYPNVKLNAYFGLQALGKTGLGLDALTADGSDIGGIGPAISVPLFKGGQLRAQYRSSEADYNEAVAAYDKTLTEALHQVADAAAGTRSTADQLKQAHTRVASARGTYELSQERFKRGLDTKIDVLRAHSLLLQAELEENNLKAQAYQDRIRFIAALGGGFQQN